MFKNIFKRKEYNFNFSGNNTISIDLTNEEYIIYIIQDNNGMIKDSGDLGYLGSSRQVERLYNLFRQAIVSGAKIKFKSEENLENRIE